MSKLSDFCKEETEKDNLKASLDSYVKSNEDNTTALISALYEKLCELEFVAYDTDDNYYLECKNVCIFDVVVIKLSKGRTTSYELAKFDAGTKPEKYIFGNYDLCVDCIDNKKPDYNAIDIGELLYYCGKKATPLVTKSKLNEEIDNGFVNSKYRESFSKKADDGRAPIGGESLEEDVKFNEWMHKKFHG